MGCTAPAYLQRRAKRSPLWALINDYFETVKRQWPERFEAEYGPWRPHWDRAIEGFLACGDLECGFARVRCSCGNESLLPFSCKRRALCPSCDARRRVEWADHLLEHVLPDLAYRHLVFTLPKVLRRIFMQDRALLGELTRTAYEVTRAFLAAQFPAVEGGVPYFVSSVHTFGSVANIHPHAHALCSAGIMDREGVFQCLPEDFDWSPLAELFRHAVLDMLVRRARLREATRTMLLNWRHSGFGADASTGTAPGDREGLLRLACYLDKSPLSLSRMQYTPGASQVLYHGKNPSAPGRGTVQYDPVAFLALVLVHVPDRYEVRVRYYGAASSTIRRGGRNGRLRRSGVEDERGPDAPVEYEGAYVKARRRTWARLLARVYGADALKCSRCGGRMRIIAFITDPEVVEKILRHVGKWGEGRGRGPPDRSPGGAEAMPSERRIIVDEYVQEFPPDDDAPEPEYDWGA
jgi:hypothetical protein